MLALALVALASAAGRTDPVAVPPRWAVRDFVASPRLDPRGYSAWRRELRMARERLGAGAIVGRTGAPPVVDSITPAWTNVRMTPQCDDFASEITLAVSRTNALRLASGANDASCGASAGLNGAFASSDGGNTWAAAPGMPNLGGTPSGDPCVAFADASDAIFSSLWNGISGMAAFRSTSSGATWSSGTIVQSVAGESEDKEWMFVDAVAGSPYQGRVYLSWDHFTGSGESVVTSYSTDIGNTWSALQTVRPDTYFVTNSVGPGGRLYVGGQDGSSPTLVVSRSTDGGVTYAQGNAYGFVGTTGGVAPFNFIQPGLDVDRGTGTSSYAGRVYLSVIDRLAGQSNYHVYLVYSTDGGVTFGPNPPIQVDEDASDTHEHAFTWLSVSPTTGSVHVFYYDFGCPAAGFTLPYRYMLASSSNGGATWHHMAVQDAPAEWQSCRAALNWVGDYEAGEATDTLIYPAWADSRTSSSALHAFVQPVPNPMPWIASVSPAAVEGATTGVTIAGGSLAAQGTPYAIVFDDPGITGAITSASAGSIQLSVAVAAGVAPGPHEWSLRYGVPVASITVAAAAKSGCQNPLQVVAAPATATPTPGGPTPTAPFTFSATATASPTLCVFGYNIVGLGNKDFANMLRASGWTAASSATYDTVHVFSQVGGAAIVAGLYADSAGLPGALLAQTSAAASVSGGWISLALPPAALAAGTTYWIAMTTSSSSNGMFRSDGPPAPVPDAYVASRYLRNWTYSATLPGTWPSAGTNFCSAAYSAFLSCAALATPTGTASATSTGTDTTTPTRSRTRTASGTDTVIPSSTATETRTPTATPTETRTATQSATRSGTTTFSATRTASTTETATASATHSSSATTTATAAAVAYPNPVSVAALGSVTFGRGATEVRIYTVAGQLVATRRSIAGASVVWDLRNDRRERIAPGLYYFAADAPSGRAIGRLVVRP